VLLNNYKKCADAPWVACLLLAPPATPVLITIPSSSQTKIRKKLVITVFLLEVKH